MKTYKSLLFACLIVIFCACETNHAQETFTTRNVVTNLNTPWEILWGPDGFIWMTERYGRISRVNPETGVLQPLYIIGDVMQGSERGLMGMALHPNFATEPYVYVVYTYSINNNTATQIRIIRLTFNGSTLESPITILENIPGAGIHDGARLWIDEDLKLFATIGDAGNTAYAQNLESLNGKLLRMNLDGSIPSDNPFPGSLVWSFGHRNPQGLVIANGILYSSEHGPGTDDELNIIEKGRNYGWPYVNGYCDTPQEIAFCEANNVVESMKSLYPSYTVAAAGLDYYNGDLFPTWKNSLLLTTLKAQKLILLKLSPDGRSVTSEENVIDGQFGRLRDICTSPNGRIFISTSNRDGRGSPKAEDDRIIELVSNVQSVKPNSSGSIDFLRIYPNPTSRELKIKASDLIIDGDIEIVDFLGNVKYKASNLTLDLNNSHSVFLDKQNFVSGIYYVILKYGNKLISEKLILN
ncbi:MAG: PQQ-dependent sugar dehydrogenase [Desulfobulbaceae bacterium]|nr:PQQ-dependent sugar dehydrogenase [Candidatus Kapabacteria bacterium]MBS4000507.1 PQQ-dependent sugar dehydrogenase [Desulfobulbaceae bacterium]